MGVDIAACSWQTLNKSVTGEMCDRSEAQEALLGYSLLPDCISFFSVRQAASASEGEVGSSATVLQLEKGFGHQCLSVRRSPLRLSIHTLQSVTVLISDSTWIVVTAFFVGKQHFFQRG